MSLFHVNVKLPFVYMYINYFALSLSMYVLIFVSSECKRWIIFYIKYTQLVCYPLKFPYKKWIQHTEIKIIVVALVCLFFARMAAAATTTIYLLTLDAPFICGVGFVVVFFFIIVPTTTVFENEFTTCSPFLRLADARLFIHSSLHFEFSIFIPSFELSKPLHIMDFLHCIQCACIQRLLSVCVCLCFMLRAHSSRCSRSFKEQEQQ